MVRFLARRLIYASTVLVGVTAIVFGLVFLAGDPVAGLLPPGSSPELQAATRQRLGLDQSVPLQYFQFLGRAVRGDFGESWRQGRPAFTVVLERLPFTLVLTCTALILAAVLSVSIGTLAGVRTGQWPDWLAQLFAVLGQAIPSFWLGTLGILLFAVRLGWLPSSGFDSAWAIVLPAVTLSVYPAATMTRLVRSSLAATMREDYIRTAHGKGLAASLIVRRHVLRNALLPTLAYAGVQFGFLVGGAVVIEGVFAYPGIGLLALTAVADRDLPVTQAFVMVVAMLIILGNVVVELVSRMLDPRLGDERVVAVGG